MKPNYFLTSALILVFLLAACSGAPEPSTTAVPPIPPATSTAAPTDTALPSNTPEPTATATETPTPQPTPTTVLYSTPMANSRPLIAGDAYFAANTNYGQLFHFTAQEGDNITILMESDFGFAFIIQTEINERLVECSPENNTSRSCAVRNYQAPYSGLYYVVTSSINQGKTFECRYSKRPLAKCFVSGPFRLVLIIE